jgi:endonuclease G
MLKFCIVFFFIIFYNIDVALAQNPRPKPKPKPKTEKVSEEDWGLPAHDKNDEAVIRHKYYTLRYREEHEQAEWVAYKLTKGETEGESERDKFLVDEMVKTGSAHPTDYAKSGYDRGHLAPAADFQFSQEAKSESFYMSNMSPQDPQFNRGIWKHLEERVRYWVKTKENLYIVTGPVLKKGLKKIGVKNKISVPEQFYKIILERKSNGEYSAIAFLMKNEPSKKLLVEFVVSIDKIEEMTGIDFFPNIPDDIEEVLEKVVSRRGWF